ncbi:MAG TPA: hypothetical protein VFN91_06620 [Myxococcaceae bacterium]|nr:hypothetical protein [Myxococcaceae bacterium]
MRIRGLTLGLVLLSGLAACGYDSGGALTVAWNFGGRSCSQVGVTQVKIAIGGEPLSQDTFDCESSLATFTNFYAGTYNVTVQGLDANGAVIWTGSQSVRLRGDTSVSVSLQPVGNQNTLTVAWTFGGGTCLGAAVDQVRIAVSGVPLSQDTFDCRNGVTTLTGFFQGTYSVTVQGLDSTGAIIWSGSQSVTVNGNANVSVDLQPLSQQNAVYYLGWTLDPATGDPGQVPLCGAGQVLDKVAIFIDDMNQSLGSYDCDQGTAGNLVITPYVTEGSHSIVLLAYNSQENVTAYAETDAFQLTFVTGGQGASQTVPLHWNVGGLQVGWAPYASMSDYNSDTRQSCTAAGIADLVLGFQSTQGGQPSVQTFSLGSSCNASVVLNNVYTGSLTPYIDACGPGGTPGLCGMQGGAQAIYRENPALVNPPTVTVQPGVFFQQSNATPFQVFIPLFHI